MLTLYYLPGCPYCEKVLAELRRLNLEAELKDVTQEGVYDELEERGGKRQEPYLVDSAHHIEMYEADDIVAYLEKTYGKDTSNESKN